MKIYDYKKDFKVLADKLKEMNIKEALTISGYYVFL